MSELRLRWLTSFSFCKRPLVKHHTPLDDDSQHMAATMAEIDCFSLPMNLEELAVARFDRLVESGELSYQPSIPQYIEHDGFKFEFHITRALKKKPIMDPKDPGRSKAIGPFVNPDPKFVIIAVGSLHTLELSMYCVHRPLLILHTNAFRPQTEALNGADIAAAWVVLHRMKTPCMILYNCGVEAGSSQGHKHLQVFPKPGPDFVLFPDKDLLSLDIPLSTPGVPYQHWALAIPPKASSVQVAEQHVKLLDKTREALMAISAVIAYNVVATAEWIVLIPRTHQSRDGVAGTNGAGMMGLVWVADQAERDQWARLGLTDHLAYLGIPSKNETD